MRAVGPAWHRRREIACAAVTLAFGALAFWNLGDVSLWADEGLQAHEATLPWLEMWRFHLRAENHPMLHHVLLKLWAQVFGTSPMALRVPSVVFGCATVVAVYVAGRPVVGERVALLASVMLAGSSYFLMSTQEIRMYPMVRFFYTVGALQAARCLVAPTRGRLLATLALLLLTWLSDVSGLFLVVLFLTGVVLRRRDLSTRGFAWPVFIGGMVGLLAVVAAAPWYMATQSKAYANPFHILSPLVVASTFGAGASFEPAPLWDPVPFARLLAVLLPLLLGAARLLRGPDDRRFVVAAAFVPWLAAPVALQVVGMNMLTERRLGFTMALVVVVVAAGLDGLWASRSTWQRALVATCLGVLLLSNVASTVNWSGEPGYQRQNWRDATRWLLPRLRPGDGVVLQTPFCVFVYRYYMGNPATLYLLGEEDLPDLAAVAPRHGRMWFVSCQGYQSDPNGVLLGWLAAHRRPSEQIAFPNLAQPDATIVIFGFTEPLPAVGERRL